MTDHSPEEELRKQIKGTVFKAIFLKRNVQGETFWEIDGNQLDDLITLFDQYATARVIDEIEFAYRMADDATKLKLQELYKDRGANMGLSFIKVDNQPDYPYLTEKGKKWLGL